MSEGGYFQIEPRSRSANRLDDVSTVVGEGTPLGTTVHDSEPLHQTGYPMHTIRPHVNESNQDTIYDAGVQRSLKYLFNPHKQQMALLRVGLARWVIMLALAGLTVGILVFYQNQQVVGTDRKRFFNAVITGLSICMGLNIASAFKELARHLRWKLISMKPHNLSELDRILGCDSLWTVTKLALLSLKRPRAHWFRVLLCILWLFLNIAAQAGVASLSLFFSYGNSEKAVISRPGLVQVPNLSRFYPGTNADPTVPLEAEQNTAHSYGEASLGLLVQAPIEGNLTGKPYFPDSSSIFFANGLPYYIFIDANNNTAFTSVYSNRNISANYSCESYAVLQGGDGTSTNITYFVKSANRTLDVISPAPNATTYITDTVDCGSRCAHVWVFQAISESSKFDTATLFDCNVTVSRVSNADRLEFEVPDQQAQIAAGAIGLNGIRSRNDSRQYTLYPPKSQWAPTGNNADLVGQMLTQFAIGVIGAAAQLNPPTSVPGNVPFTGEMLTVEWKWVSLVLGLLVVIHFFIFVLLTCVASLVVVKDDSHLAIAGLLGPLVTRRYNSGSMRNNEGKVVYGVRMSEPGVWHLDVDENIRPSGLTKSFPSGWYDTEVAGYTVHEKEVGE